MLSPEHARKELVNSLLRWVNGMEIGHRFKISDAKEYLWGRQKEALVSLRTTFGRFPFESGTRSLLKRLEAAGVLVKDGREWVCRADIPPRFQA